MRGVDYAPGTSTVRRRMSHLACCHSGYESGCPARREWAPEKENGIMPQRMASYEGGFEEAVTERVAYRQAIGRVAPECAHIIDWTKVEIDQALRFGRIGRAIWVIAMRGPEIPRTGAPRVARQDTDGYVHNLPWDTAARLFHVSFYGIRRDCDEAADLVKYALRAPESAPLECAAHS